MSLSKAVASSMLYDDGVGNTVHDGLEEETTLRPKLTANYHMKSQCSECLNENKGPKRKDERETDYMGGRDRTWFEQEKL